MKDGTRSPNAKPISIGAHDFIYGSKTKRPAKDCTNCRHSAVVINKGKNKFTHACRKGHEVTPTAAKDCPDYRDARNPLNILPT